MDKEDILLFHGFPTVEHVHLYLRFCQTLQLFGNRRIFFHRFNNKIKNQNNEQFNKQQFFFLIFRIG